MKIKTPITKARLRTHLAYNFWKYLIAIVGSIFAWNLIYTTTAYRAPQEKRVDLYIQSTYITEESTEKFIKPIWESSVPDMETVTSVILAGSADYYSNMQLSVYIMAGEGDIYLLSTADFKNFASQGAFIDLAPYIESGQINVEGIDISAGKVALVNDEGLPVGDNIQFGIPAYTLSGYTDMGMQDYGNIVMAVTTFNGNQENVLKFFDAFIQAGRASETGTAQQ
ncbi:MAG: hypothetical protein IK133_04915 [Clostridia bacterium]|nr:hypothetical protein [Clostridia bacterium]MBR5383145.1 hypothetical protein [Clostridia bacterium]